MFIGVVLFSPGGVAGWLMLHAEAARRGEALAACARLRAGRPALAAGLAGAILLIELADRQLALARSEGSAMRLFGFDRCATSGPWIVADRRWSAPALARGRLLWPRGRDAWGAVDVRIRAGRAKA